MAQTLQRWRKEVWVLVLSVVLLLGRGAAGEEDKDSSGSVLGALLNSEYTQMVELLERAGILQPLESLVGREAVTIFAPKGAFLETVDPRFRRWLLEPGSAHHLQKLLQHHVVMGDVPASQWRDSTLMPVSEEPVDLSLRLQSRGHRHSHRQLYVDQVEVVAPDSIVRRDGRVHGLRELVVPLSVRQAFSLWKKLGPLILPPPASFPVSPTPAPAPEAALPPSLHRAWAPAPGPSAGPFLGNAEQEVENFVDAMLGFGGYKQVANLVSNVTSLASDLSYLLKSGHRFTFLAPNDDAVLAHFTSRQLTVGGDSVEPTLLYHIIPEYLSEEVMYNSVKQDGQTIYATLRQPYTLTAQEAFGTVEFGQGNNAAIIYDHNIFSDGRISVIGVTKVLLPPTTQRKLGEIDELDASILSFSPNAAGDTTRLWKGLHVMIATLAVILTAF